MVFIALVSCSCGRKVVAISENEQKVLDELAKEFNVTAKIELDYYAINRDSNDGKYFVDLKFSTDTEFCMLDSIQRYQIMKITKEKVIPVISYPENHSVLVICMNTMGEVRNGAQKAICIERYIIQLSNDSIIEYSGQFENQVVHW